MRKLGIIGAMELEITTLKDTMKIDRIVEKAGMQFYEGQLADLPCVVVKCGIGKVNAGICVQILSDLFEVTHIINTGIAGSLNASLDIGEIVVSTGAIQHDVDVTVFGYAPGQIPGFENRLFSANQEMADIAITACTNANKDIHAIKGLVVSGDQFISDAQVKDRIIKEYNADCVEMEGASIAQAATLNQIPFIIIRAISDKADNSAEMDYPTFEREAAKHCANMVLAFAHEFAL